MTSPIHSLMPNTADFSTSEYALGGIQWVVLEAGQGYPLFLVHGFPDTPYTFRQQVQPFVDAGFRVILPYLPGYAPSRVEGGYYNSANLGADFAALIQAMGLGEVAYLGHDWGALAGHLLAVVAPERVSRLVSCTLPHGEGLKHADGKQLWRSRYMFYFQLPGAVSLVRRNKLNYIRKLIGRWSPDWRDKDDHVRAVIDCLAAENTLAVAMGYYRTMFREAITNSEMRKVMNAQVPVDTLAVAGRNDGCIGLSCLEGQASGFSAGYQLKIIDGAGHFCHAEKPREFNRAVLGFLGDLP